MSSDERKRSFRAAVCQHFRCAPEAYEEMVFRQCLYRHATGLAWLIRRFVGDYFESDFQLIRFVADKTDVEDLRAEIRLHRTDQPPGTLLRRFLRVRLSGQRLLALGDQLLSAQPVQAAPDAALRGR